MRSHPRDRVRRTAPVWAAGLLVALLLSGCPAEEEEVPDAPLDQDAVQPGEFEDDVIAYCQAAAALDEQEEPPTEEQLEELAHVAPSGIESEVQVVAERYAEQGVDAFGDPEVQEALERLEEWEAENCP